MSTEGPSERLLSRLPLLSDRPGVAYGAALLLTGASILLRLAAQPLLPVGYPFISFFPAVILTTFLLGRGPGTLTAVLCGIAAWYFFIRPFDTLQAGAGIAVSMLFYAAIAALNIMVIDWMQRSNRRLERERARSQAVAERTELLFRELQHRISNNLQVVAALLALQKRNVTDQAARVALDEASRRLALIGRIQRQLHEPSGDQLGLGNFLMQIARDLVDAAGRPELACSVEADDGVTLPPDSIIPVALIVAEAITNAIEHGFAGQEQGSLRLRVVRQQGDLVLSVHDDGRGLPEGFDLKNAENLGLRIATTLARQLGGRFELKGSAGTTALLTLPG